MSPISYRCLLSKARELSRRADAQLNNTEPDQEECRLILEELDELRKSIAEIRIEIARARQASLAGRACKGPDTRRWHTCRLRAARAL